MDTEPLVVRFAGDAGAGGLQLRRQYVLSQNEAGRMACEDICRTAIVEACAAGDQEEVEMLLERWSRVRPGKHDPRTGQVIVSSVTMADAEKTDYLKQLVSADRKRR